MRSILMLGLVTLTGYTTAQAHFLQLLPSTDIVTSQTPRVIDLTIVFTHPMEGGPVMGIAQPTQFGVLTQAGKRDLKPVLKPITVAGETAYRARYEITAPGDYVFYVEPARYWEPAEDKYITHFTKVVVDGFGAETGWDAMVGFPVEIEPLVRPYGLWTGNTFRGIVRHRGEPAAFAKIEVEYLNQDGQVEIPADPFITQVIKADAGGVFSYTIPRAGWWGFAALIEGPSVQGPDEKTVGHEVGGLIWVKTVDMR